MKSAEYWRQRLNYDPVTGSLTFLPRPLDDFPSERIWKCWNSAHAGQSAFNQKAAHGYRVGRWGGVNYYSHRIIWQMVHGHVPDNIDHINGDGWDNRLFNLRECTHAENHRNMKRNRRNKSGVMGVQKSFTKWEARVGYKRIGRFDTFEEAKAARQVHATLHGFTENHGDLREVRR